MLNARKSHGNGQGNRTRLRVQFDAPSCQISAVALHVRLIRPVGPIPSATLRHHCSSPCNLGLNIWFHTVKLPSVLNSTLTQSKPLKPTKGSPGGISISSAPPKSKTLIHRNFFIQSHSKLFKGLLRKKDCLFFSNRAPALFFPQCLCVRICVSSVPICG